MKKDKVRFGTIVGILLFVGLLVAGLFYLSYGIEQNFSGKTESIGIQKNNVRFTDAYWRLIDFPLCELADKENRVMQDIELIYNINYYYIDYSCTYQITTYYSDGLTSTTQSRTLDETTYSLKGFNVFDSYKIDICCSDGINRVCKSKDVKSYC